MANLDRCCDLVMKGGITSGVVYPKLIEEVASRFHLVGIAGTIVVTRMSLSFPFLLTMVPLWAFDFRKKVLDPMEIERPDFRWGRSRPDLRS